MNVSRLGPTLTLGKYTGRHRGKGKYREREREVKKDWIHKLLH